MQSAASSNVLSPQDSSLFSASIHHHPTSVFSRAQLTQRLKIPFAGCTLKGRYQMMRYDELTYSEWQHVIGTLTLCFPKNALTRKRCCFSLLQTSGEGGKRVCLGNRFCASWWKKMFLYRLRSDCGSSLPSTGVDRIVVMKCKRVVLPHFEKKNFTALAQLLCVLWVCFFLSRGPEERQLGPPGSPQEGDDGGA